MRDHRIQQPLTAYNAFIGQRKKLLRFGRRLLPSRQYERRCGRRRRMVRSPTLLRWCSKR